MLLLLQLQDLIPFGFQHGFDSDSFGYIQLLFAYIEDARCTHCKPQEVGKTQTI